jgi:hypothetical protein
LAILTISQCPTDHGRGGERNHLEFCALGLIQQDWSGLAAGVVAIAAPEPWLRFEEQSALHRVAAMEGPGLSVVLLDAAE